MYKIYPILALLVCGCKPQSDYVVAPRPDLSHASDSLIAEFEERWLKFQSSRGATPDREALAKFYHANGFYQEALALYDSLMGEDPSSAKWPYLTHRIAQDLGEVYRAIDLLDESIRNDRDFVVAHLRKADLLAKIGDYAEATVAYGICLDLSPNHAHSLLGLGRIAMLEGNWESARRYFSLSVASDPTLGANSALLSNVFSEIGKVEDMLILERFSEQQPKFREVDDPLLDGLMEHCFDVYRLKVSADIFMDTGRDERALPLLLRAKELSPRDPETLLSIGKWHLRNGSRSEGLALVEQSMKLDPNFEDAYFVAMIEYQSDGKHEAVLDLAQVGIERFPDSPKFFRVAGLSFEKQGNLSEARKSYKRALAVDPNDVPSLVAMGNFLYWTLNEKSNAVVQYEKVRSLSRSEHDIRVLLATYYFEINRLEDMIACINEARQISSESNILVELEANYYLKIGNRFAQRNLPEMAKGAYLEGLKLMPKYIDLNVNLAILLIKQKEAVAAKKHLEGLIDSDPEVSFAYPYLVVARLELGEMDGLRELIDIGLKVSDRQGDRSAHENLLHLAGRL